MNDLSHLKVGDKVARDIGWNDIAICSITGETAKYWVVNGTKYRKNNGRAMGGGYRSSYLRLLTPDILEQVEHTKCKHLWGKIRDAKLPSHLTSTQLQEIYDLITQAEVAE